MSGYENRRKIVNIIDPRAQLRFAIPFVVLTVVSLVVINLIFFQIYQLRNTAGDDNATVSIIGPLTQMLNQILWVSSIGMMLIGALSIAFWIVYSHRVFGPVVAIRRHILALQNGDYSSRCRLRQSDELKDVADDLNDLAEKLQAQRQQNL